MLLLGIFEASLAIAFGWLVAWLGAHDRPGFVIGIFVMFLSAAVSIFNIQWLLFGHGVQLMEEKILLAGIAAISCWAACYLIGFHLRRRKSRQGVGNQFLRQLNNGGGLYGWQIFAFVVMYGAAVTPGP